MLTQKEVCQRLRVTRRTLFKFRKLGLLVPRNLPGSRAVRYREIDVDRFERGLPQAR